MSENPGNTVTFDKEQLKQLKKQLKGKALVPGDWGYDKASRVWDFTGFEQRPAIVILPENAADVQAAVRFARENNLPIGVQSGGHGHPHPANDAMFINFEKMDKIEVDKDAARVRFEPGVVFKDLIKEVTKHDLAPLNGFGTSVGATGYMLGGGVGFLTRHYGSGAGSIRQLELVTADADLLKVNETNHPELFWGLRGGGGNFGVITALECQLYPVKKIFGGQVVYPIEKGKEVLAAYLKFTETAPDELTTAVRVMQFPPVHGIPLPGQHKIAVVIMACYSGENLDQGEAVLAPLRSLDDPVLDTFDSLDYSDIARVSKDPTVPPPFYLYTDGGSVKSFTPGDIENFINIAGDPDSGIAVAELRHLGGALAGQDENEMAFTFRDTAYYIYIQAAAPEQEALEKSRQAIQSLMGKMKPSMPGRLMLNFIDSFGEAGPDGTGAAYPPATYQRLRDLKSKFDPENVFRFNHNIPPASQSGG